MKEKDEIRKYRIGDYSAYMGVTPDFLKHYEQFNLVFPETGENGYRYYPFNQSYKILECIRLRNYGFSIRDIEKLLNDDDFANINDKMDRKIEEIERRIEFEKEIVSDYQRMKECLEKTRDQKSAWYIAETEDLYFLPHSNDYDFLMDERIYAVLHDWMSWLPVVKSCLEIRGCEDFSEEPTYSWGLSVSKSFAEKYKIPVNRVVKIIPGQKCFIYIYKEERVGAELRFPQVWKIYSLLKKLGLRPAGNIYDIVFMYSHINDQTSQCRACMVPL
ncbi:MAG: helix-turn-helix domain-containing protein [Lachnospiraceae bacterium]|nr:helix-turn-helix domain-containing protein [Lachnospiraceae bacterium]